MHGWGGEDVSPRLDALGHPRQQGAQDVTGCLTLSWANKEKALLAHGESAY